MRLLARVVLALTAVLVVAIVWVVPRPRLRALADMGIIFPEVTLDAPPPADMYCLQHYYHDFNDCFLPGGWDAFIDKGRVVMIEEWPVPDTWRAGDFVAILGTPDGVEYYSGMSVVYWGQFWIFCVGDPLDPNSRISVIGKGSREHVKTWQGFRRYP